MRIRQRNAAFAAAAMLVPTEPPKPGLVTSRGLKIE